MKASCSTSSASVREPSIRTANRVQVSRYRWNNSPNDSTSPPRTSAISWASDRSFIEERLMMPPRGHNPCAWRRSSYPVKSLPRMQRARIYPGPSSAERRTRQRRSLVLWGGQRQNDREAVVAGGVQRPAVKRLEEQRGRAARGRSTRDEVDVAGRERVERPVRRGAPPEIRGGFCVRDFRAPGEVFVAPALLPTSECAESRPRWS